MNKIGFFTSIQYCDETTLNQKIWNGIEEFFNFGNHSIYVITRERIDGTLELQEKDLHVEPMTEIIMCALKVIACLTALIPLIVLSAKLWFRSSHELCIVSPENHTIPELSNNVADLSVKVSKN